MAEAPDEILLICTLRLRISDERVGCLEVSQPFRSFSRQLT
jgi:hypothetical protein